MRRRLRGALGALVTLAALAGCTSQKDAMIAQGADPAYAEGYEDGCTSGNKAGGSPFDSDRKDAARYGPDSQYTKGWDDAFDTCKAKMAVMVEDARRRSPSRDKSG
jgi:hypothetical protein